MAEFCTKCAKEMFGDKFLPDIDVEKEFNSLEDGFVSSGFICEGCGLIAIAKEKGKLKVLRIKENKETGVNEENNDWEPYEYDGLPDTAKDI